MVAVYLPLLARMSQSCSHHFDLSALGQIRARYLGSEPYQTTAPDEVAMSVEIHQLNGHLCRSLQQACATCSFSCAGTALSRST